MINLHEYYYKDYFSLQDAPVKNVNRHLDYELLIDDTRKNNLGNQIRRLENEARNARGQQKMRLEAQIEEMKAQLSVNVDVLKVRNKLLTGYEFVKKDSKGKPTRDLLDEAFISNDVTEKVVNNDFCLNIQYPGLVTGIGITHEAKIEGEFKLGVHFDWTYGMPVIYGSSVKGVLRSAFKDGYVDADMIAKVNKENPSINIPEWVDKPENRGAIIDEIFEGGKKSIYERDIFFDAVIKHADPKGRILCSDSITPHLQGPLKNPIPITFMKIAPGCTLEFRFKLVTSDIDGKEFNAEQKKALFKEILKTVGVGAKTNVGYGQLE